MYVDKLISEYKSNYNPNIKMYTRYTNKDWKEIASYLINNNSLELCEKIVINMERDSKLAMEMSQLMVEM